MIESPKTRAIPSAVARPIFRAIVVTVLTLFAFQTAIIHAARETICCAYPPFIAIADALEAFPAIFGAYLLALVFLSLIGPILALLAVRQGQGTFQTALTDWVFSVGAWVGVHFGWIVAMGHSERNWATGFWGDWVSLQAVYAATILVTRSQSDLRARLLWSLTGVVLAAGLPGYMVHLKKTVSIGGELFLEEHGASTRYIFGILITSSFWARDTFVSVMGGLETRRHSTHLRG